jgi:type I restriction enzyme M protein
MNGEAWAWAQLRFLVLGLTNIELAIGNALTNRAFTRFIPKDGFDLVLTNPPFGHLDPQTTSLLSHGSSNSSMRLPGRPSSEAAYIQETLSSLSNSGRAAVIVPNGFLSRGGADQKLRETLVRNGAVQAIVGLPERLFAPGTTIETAILFLNRRKPNDQKGRVLFVDARKLGRRDGARLVLDHDSTNQIRTVYKDWRDEAGFSRIVSLDELDPTSFSFSPARYVKPVTPVAISPYDRRSRIAELDARYSELHQEYEAIRLRLTQLS